ncbi:splicing regulator ARVCF-like [Gadus macrocephalus]|uniref:splicing regulator ARVCF-like n=1 Tax=Gadus macrocephalus TaxID=80720 RepID=UPI0028CB95FE|nr:splicing regulator ARVCF-like [Gadus macrocephalus]
MESAVICSSSSSRSVPSPTRPQAPAGCAASDTTINPASCALSCCTSRGGASVPVSADGEPELQHPGGGRRRPAEPQRRQWTWSNYIRATVRKEKGLPILVELLRSDSDKVVRAVAIALRNLSIDRRNKDLIGSYAMRDLVSNLPSGQQRPAKNLEEDTVVAILNTIHEIVTDSSENARSLIQAQAVEKLVAINRTSQSSRETKAASHVLQTVWGYKDLRNALTKDGWNKSHFQPTVAATPKSAKNGKPGYDDTTLPLMEKNQDGYTTIDHREKECKYKAVDPEDPTEHEPLKNDTNRKHYIRGNRPAISLVDACDVKPQPVDSWV